MKILEWYYKSRNKPIPYYAKYSILRIIWVPIRKTLNVVIIPNIPFNGIRIMLYRLIGFQIGKGVFIGMKCYLDDLEPQNTTIGDNVIISYGCFFSLHGRGQSRSKIEIKNRAYLGMRTTVVARGSGIVIGENTVIGAASLVINDVDAGKTAVGVPAKVIP